MKPLQRFLNQLIPFVFIGIAIVAFAFGIMLFAYLFLIGAIVGFALFVAAWIKKQFSRQKIPTKPTRPVGRVIDLDDWKKG